MDKCECCLMVHRYYDSPEVGYIDWCPAVEIDETEGLESCHLTPDHQRFIDAMIRGKCNCENCIHYEKCIDSWGLAEDFEYVGDSYFCADWQEKKGVMPCDPYGETP